jgi:shikimate kinase
MKLVLIGLRGTGKSTVGKILADRLCWEFVDTDTLVQERAGLTIREIFEQNGESHFRKLETEVVQESAQKDKAVIATGGGAVLNPQNVRALKQNGFVVHLSADPTELWHRIVQDKTSHASRPKLVENAESGIDELKKLMHARAAVYAQTRDVEVSVEDRSPAEVADAVQILMRTHGVLAK